MPQMNMTVMSINEDRHEKEQNGRLEIKLNPHLVTKAREIH